MPEDNGDPLNPCSAAYDSALDNMTPDSPFIGLLCPHCETEDSMSVDLDDFTFRCRECEEEVSHEAIVQIVTGWARVLKWIGMARTIAERR